MTVIAVAAVSARVLAEAGARDGFDVVALDLFGDVDTCAVASRWFPIGPAGSLQIDAGSTLSALRLLAQRGDVIGWVAGSGFEGRPELLAEGAALLRLIGTAPDAVRKVRDPTTFFATLDRLGMPHPDIAMSPPADAAGWLVKDTHGCGGWHIRAALPGHDEGAPPGSAGSTYFQRLAHGVPMSATFVANGHDAVVLGFNELIVRPLGRHPWIFHGAVGPLPSSGATTGAWGVAASGVADAVVRRVTAAVRGLSAAFALQGLCSLDFMLAGDDVAVLEINPRPPATMAFHADHGAFAVHVDACLRGTLPATWPVPGPARTVEGFETLFARRAFALDAAAARQLAAWPGAHDLPCAGARFGPGDPICSVAASGDSVASVHARLAESRDALLGNLET